MVKQAILFFIFFIHFVSVFPHAITNGFEPWRRLGDNILTVSKTKYFSQEHDLEYYYTPFPYIDSFKFVHIEQLLTPELKNSFSKIIFIHSAKDVTDNLSSKESILFVCTYLSIAPSMYEYVKNNAEFEKNIHHLFTPLESIAKLDKKTQEFILAVHVRKGGGFDWPLASEQEFEVEIPIVKNKEIFLYKRDIGMNCEDIWPLHCLPGPAYISQTKYLAFKKKYYADYIWAIKFPPDQYYIEQIKTAISLTKLKALTIKLFTDDPHPQDIVKRYQNALKDVPVSITFDYRKSENNHDKNVIEDLFALAECDGLISASSSFAFTAMILGNHSIMIHPEHAITLPDKVLIDKVKVIKVDNRHDPLKRTINISMYSINLL